MEITSLNCHTQEGELGTSFSLVSSSPWNWGGFLSMGHFAVLM